MDGATGSQLGSFHPSPIEKGKRKGKRKMEEKRIATG